jgi:hypothetical protein
MRRFSSGMVLVLIALFVSGCGGDGRINARGRLLKGGEPFPLKEDEGMRIIFVPAETGGQTYDSFLAVYKKEDGSFKVAGKDGKGLPPGKYRIAIEHVKKNSDLLKKKFSTKNTPFVREVTSSSEEIIIDLDKPNS